MSSSDRVDVLEQGITNLADALLRPREKDPIKRQAEREGYHSALLKSLNALVSLAHASEDYAVSLEDTIASYTIAVNAETGSPPADAEKMEDAPKA